MQEKDSIEKVLEPWPGRDIQRVLTIKATLDLYGYTFDDIKNYLSKTDIQIVHARPKRDRQRRRKQSYHGCPECGWSMELHRADEGVHWICPKCRYSFYKERPLKKEYFLSKQRGKKVCPECTKIMTYYFVNEKEGHYHCRFCGYGIYECHE